MRESERFALENYGRTFNTRFWGRNPPEDRDGWMVVGYIRNTDDLLVTYVDVDKQKRGARPENYRDSVLLMDVCGCWKTSIERMKRSMTVWVDPPKPVVPPRTLVATPDTGVHPGVRLMRRVVVEDLS